MREITVPQLLKDMKTKSGIILGAFFTICGWGIVLLPLAKAYSTSSVNTVISILFLLCCFGIPIGYFGGVRTLLKNIRRRRAIVQGTVMVEKDIVSEKRISFSGRSDELDDICQLALRKYTKKTGKYVNVKRRIYEAVEEGAVCHMIYNKKTGELLHLYPAEECSINMLMEKWGLNYYGEGK